MVITMSQIRSSWTDSDYAEWASEPDIIYILNYINVTLLTVFVIVLFALLCGYLSQKNKAAALTGIAFIPVYGTLNIVCYSIQISVVPMIARDVLSTSGDVMLAARLIQAKSDSIVGFINGLAYAVLGIPSVIYGYMLIKSSKKVSGVLLLINGVLCIIGIIGYMTDNAVLSLGVMAGGAVFLISLIFMILDFGNKKAVHDIS